MLAGGAERPLDEPARDRIMAAGDGFARSGLRVLAVARGAMRGPGLAGVGLGRLPAEDIETDMTFLGLVAMMDPPRPEVEEAYDTWIGMAPRPYFCCPDWGSA